MPSKPFRGATSFERRPILTDESTNTFSISMDALQRWDEAHPPTAVPGEFVIHVHPDILKCDDCGAQADMLHFLNSDGQEGAVGDVRDARVKFSCPNHSFGGYEVDFARLFAGLGGGRSFLTHIAEKNWGLFAVAELRKRLSEIEREAQIEEGYTA
jgi:hypothetical protein